MKKLVVFNDHWCSGGVESLWTNIIDSVGINNDISITILATQKETDIYDEILKRNNVEIVTVLNHIIKNPIKRTLENMKNIKKKLIELQPDIFHINSCNASGLKIAKLAKKLGIKTVIVHAHVTSIQNDKFKLKLFMHKFWRFKYSKYPDFCYACSKMAGEFMFKKKRHNEMIIFKNGVKLDRYDFNLEYRDEIRSKYSLSNEILIGHIGRFNYQKNHTFLIDIFNEVHKLNHSAKLLLLGEGPLKEEILNKIKSLKLEGNIIDAGVTDEAYKYYQAFDAFILPSLCEGLPVVGVEAQASGLPVLYADTITPEAKILDETLYLSLEDKPKLWAQEVLRLSNLKRESVKDIIKASGFDIIEESNKLFDFYNNL